ncbi:MAG: type II toxin-antitoxin system antitoxin, RelB/DinJ family [Deltaproteobacteria bacterium]|nr:MAG: type II toxin-antitoxin system antitoxin, RelB/DinJ family [Deltaproteobacteria bacterium]
MKKTTTVRAMIAPEKKQKAGEILARLGMNHSEAINIFYSLIIENEGLPFPVRLPDRKKGQEKKDTPMEPNALDPVLLSHLKKSARINLRLGRGLP